MTRKPIGLSVPYRRAQYSDIVSDGGFDPRNKFDTPQPRKWVDLTLADKQALLDDNYGGSRADVIDRTIKLFKEKNA